MFRYILENVRKIARVLLSVPLLKVFELVRRWEEPLLIWSQGGV